MKISVIIPVYNCENTIKRCVNSVIKQSYGNLEILLVDDGSQDFSGKICDEFALLDERIRVVHQPNKGVSAARNAGLDIATGEYITFVDSDDFLEKNMYEKLIALKEKYNVELVHCGYLRVENDKEKLVNGTNKIIIQNRKEAIECLLMGKLFTGSPWNKLFNRKLIDDIRFDTNLKINEDVLFCYQAFVKCKRSVYIDDALYHYVVTDGSACFITPTEKKLQDTVSVSKKIYLELKDTSLKNIALERYLTGIINLSRFYLKNLSKYRMAFKKSKEELYRLYKQGNNLSNRIKLNILLMIRFPILYQIIYYMYDKVRIPNWDPK